MKIRTQLVLALFLLAIVPLAGIVLYSYSSSLRAVREAVEEEAAGLTLEMEERVAAIQEDLSRRVERVGASPAWRSLGEADPDDRAGRDSAVGLLLSELGEAAPLLRSLEFVPAEAPPPAPAAEPTASPRPVPAPPPPRAWVIDLSAAMESLEAELEQELEGELPESAREKILTGLKIGAEAVERATSRTPASWQERVSQWERELETVALRLEEDAERRAQLQAQQSELQNRAMALHREHQSELHRQRPAEAGEVELPVRVEVPIRDRGEVVGSFRARISPQEVLHRALGRARRDQGEIPFAVDREGRLVTLEEEDREQLEALPIDDLADGDGAAAGALANWVVVTRQEPTSGLTFGIARPIRESLEQVRTAAARNFGYGLALIGVALIGILPLSRRMTRGLQAITDSAERVAKGDLSTRVPVAGRGEIGQLANAFNRMAYDLERNREKLIEEEELRRDQEVRQQVLEAENRRKSDELEDARRFQLSLLPRALPEHPAYEVAVAMRTATEVGGDYYDFSQMAGGALVAAVGDATGHGARAGTMVTVVKSLFSAHPPEGQLGEFLREASEAVRRMELGRMAMALCLARFEGRSLSFSSAGMPPALVRRGDGTVEELAAPGMPLGALAGAYEERTTELEPGDVVLLMSDGLPELPDADGEPLGYERVEQAVARATDTEPQALIDALLRSADAWAGEGPPNDDITFVALRLR